MADVTNKFRFDLDKLLVNAILLHKLYITTNSIRIYKQLHKKKIPVKFLGNRSDTGLHKTNTRNSAQIHALQYTQSCETVKLRVNNLVLAHLFD